MSGWLPNDPSLTSQPAAPAGPPESGNGSPRTAAPAGWVPAQAPVRPAPQAVVLKSLLLAVFSGKGGAGKTSVSTAIAALLARQYEGYKVCLVDCDPSYGQLAYTLGMPLSFAWSDALALDPAGIVSHELAAALPQHPVGFWLLASRGGSAAFCVSLEAAEAVIRVLAQEFDALVLDCSDHLADPMTQAALKLATKRLVVVEPDTAAVAACTQALEILREHGLFDPEKTLVALNKVDKFHDVGRVRTAIEGRGGGSLWENWGLRVAGVIPSDPAVAQARVASAISVLAKPNAPSSRALKELVARLVPAAAKPAGGGRFRLFRGR